jgi:DNA repair exonuclease SbcCD ATPase subunit
LQTDGEALEAETARLLQAAKEARLEIEALGKQKEDMKSLKANVSKLDGQVSASAKEIAALKAKRDALKNESLPAAQAELDEQKRNGNGDGGDKDAKQAALASAKQELAEREAALKAATKQANDASAKARESKQTLESHIQKINAQMAVITKQIQDAEKLRTQKQKKTADAAKKKQDQEQSQIESSRAEQQRLQRLFDDITAAHLDLKEANDRLSSAAAESDGTEEVASLGTEVQRWREENRTQTAVLHDADATVARLQDELVAARKRQLDRQSTLDAKAEQRRTTELTALKHKTSKQQTATDIINGEVDSLTKQIKGMEDQRQELQSELNTVLEDRRRALEAEATLTSPKRSSKGKDPTSPKTSKKGTSGRKSEAASLVAETSDAGIAQSNTIVAGRLRRGTSMLLQQTRGDDDGSSLSAADGTSHSDEEVLAELEKRLSTIRRQNDTDEVAIERLLRDKKGLEDDIKQMNDGLVSKSVQQAAGLFSGNHATTVSLDLNEAGKEAVRHQLIKARSKQSTLLKEQDRLHVQLTAAEQSFDDARRRATEGSQQSIAAIIAGLRPEDWRLAYLVEQLETKGKQIQELESQCTAIPHLEEQLQMLKESLSALQQSNQMNSSMSVSSRRPPPF